MVKCINYIFILIFITSIVTFSAGLVSLSPDSSQNSMSDWNKNAFFSEKNDIYQAFQVFHNNTSSFLLSIFKGEKKWKVILDPGHGGLEEGVISADGFSEKRYNLEMAYRVKQMLENNNISVIMSRTSDSFIKCKSRKRLRDTVNPDAFVSIHANANPEPEVNGIEIYYYTGKSKILARQISDNITNMINNHDFNTKNRGLIKNRFLVIFDDNLKDSIDIPSVLVETGYISNYADKYEMVTEKRKKASAEAIANGIIDYLENQSSNS